LPTPPTYKSWLLAAGGILLAATFLLPWQFPHGKPPRFSWMLMSAQSRLGVVVPVTCAIAAVLALAAAALLSDPRARAAVAAALGAVGLVVLMAAGLHGLTRAPAVSDASLLAFFAGVVLEAGGLAWHARRGRSLAAIVSTLLGAAAVAVAVFLPIAGQDAVWQRTTRLSAFGPILLAGLVGLIVLPSLVAALTRAGWWSSLTSWAVLAALPVSVWVFAVFSVRTPAGHSLAGRVLRSPGPLIYPGIDLLVLAAFLIHGLVELPRPSTEPVSPSQAAAAQ
jgi:hypothetical protein